MTNNTLYEIRSDYKNLVDMLELMMDEEIDIEKLEAINEKLAINRSELMDKSEAYAAVISKKKARAAYLKDEAKRLSAMAARELKVVDSLSERISEAMTDQGIPKIETAHFKFSFRKSTSVKITDMSVIPDRFKRVKVVTEPDKTKLKNHLKAFGELDGAELVETQNLQIK